MIRSILPSAVLSSALLFVSTALAETSNGITTVDVKGGGTIAYAQMPKQSDPKAALGKVLGYVKTHWGARPDVSRVVHSRNGNILAAIYTLTATQNGSGKMVGLALVVARSGQPLEGATLIDQEDHFRKSFGPMLDHLVAKATAAEKPDGSASSGSSPKAAPASVATQAPAAAQATPSGPQAPAQPLHQNNFGSGSIGLPAGWTLGQSHAGEVNATGPKGEIARFGAANTASDPNNPQSRATPGFAKIPYGSDAVTTFMGIVKFNSRNGTVPTHQFSTVKDISGSGGQHDYFMVGDLDRHDGKGQLHEWVHLNISPPLMMGGYQVTISQVVVPEALASSEANTVAAMFASYHPDYGAIAGQARADAATNSRITAAFSSYARGITDLGDRSTAAMSDYLVGDTVVRDRLLNGHARVDDDLADALVDVDPDRFEKVPAGQYIRGIDY